MKEEKSLRKEISEVENELSNSYKIPSIARSLCIVPA